MSLRVYVKLEEVVPPSQPNTYGRTKEGDFVVYDWQKKEPYVEMHSQYLPDTTSLPAGLERAVVKITYHTSFESGKYRTPGEYKFRTAVAVLETGGRSLQYNLRIQAKDLADASELYRRIRAGTLYPQVSYMTEQVAPPVRQLGDLWKEFVRLISRDVTRIAWKK